ncbi:MAG: S41 family peptidase [Chitinophagales bacterium]|nr:S41 family peptidase [Chitinophagales bacterium]
MKKLILFTFFAATMLGVNAQMYQQKMATFLKLLDNYYVSDVNADSLVDVGMKHILKQLDPHSVYFTADEYAKANEPLEGNFEGVGIQFQIYEDTLIVVHVIDGGPSQKVGLLDGDKIIYVDTTLIAGVGINNEDVFKYLKGKKGTKVTVKVLRYGEQELLDFEIIRDKIPIYAVTAQYMVDDEIGYIKLSRFSATATEEVEAAIDSLKNKGMTKLILDLTGNGGGYLSQAQALSDLFLNDGKLIVYSEGKSQERQDLVSTTEGNFQDGQLVVMIDQSSASASEIVSGAIQDWDRGLVIGRRSFGKGLVQKGYFLPDKSVVRLTMAHYYTPSGRNIQRSYEKGKDEYYEDINERYKSGELFDATKIPIKDSTKYYTNAKRVVYAGGGIIPDIFVPIDTTNSVKFYNKLIRTGSFNQFALKYVNDNRNTLSDKYSTEEKYIDKFNIDKTLFDAFIDFAKEKKATIDSTETMEEVKPLIDLQLKALIGQNLFNYNIYYKIINIQDDIYRKAIESFSNGAFKEHKIVSKDKPFRK